MVAHDLHPDYLPTRFAREYAAQHGLPLIGVQHHEAHVGSVLADTGYEKAVVGLAFDGTGGGPDGTIWGGDFFSGSAKAFRREAHLGVLPLFGAEMAIRQPWRLGLALLDLLREEGGEDDETLARWLGGLPGGPELLHRPWRAVIQAGRRGVNAPRSSSAGRLFDAVSALLGFRHEITYEGQAAILLEAAARRAFSGRGGLPGPVEPPPWHFQWPSPGPAASEGREAVQPRPDVLPLAPFAAALLADLGGGLQPDHIAARFHHSLAAGVSDLAARLAERADVEAVALGGGVFQEPALPGTGGRPPGGRRPSRPRAPGGAHERRRPLPGPSGDRRRPVGVRPAQRMGDTTVMRYVDEYRDPEMARALLREIHEVRLAGPVTFMEVCGSHTMALSRFGIRSLLPEGVRPASASAAPAPARPRCARWTAPWPWPPSPR